MSALETDARPTAEEVVRAMCSKNSGGSYTLQSRVRSRKSNHAQRAKEGTVDVLSWKPRQVPCGPTRWLPNMNEPLLIKREVLFAHGGQCVVVQASPPTPQEATTMQAVMRWKPATGQCCVRPVERTLHYLADLSLCAKPSLRTANQVLLQKFVASFCFGYFAGAKKRAIALPVLQRRVPFLALFSSEEASTFMSRCVERFGKGTLDWCDGSVVLLRSQIGPVNFFPLREDERQLVRLLNFHADYLGRITNHLVQETAKSFQEVWTSTKGHWLLRTCARAVAPLFLVYREDFLHLSGTEEVRFSNGFLLHHQRAADGDRRVRLLEGAAVVPFLLDGIRTWVSDRKHTSRSNANSLARQTGAMMPSPMQRGSARAGQNSVDFFFSVNPGAQRTQMQLIFVFAKGAMSEPPLYISSSDSLLKTLRSITNGNGQYDAPMESDQSALAPRFRSMPFRFSQATQSQSASFLVDVATTDESHATQDTSDEAALLAVFNASHHKRRRVES